jgi:hypothetical protein
MPGRPPATSWYPTKPPSVRANARASGSADKSTPNEWGSPGSAPNTHATTADDHKRHYPGAQPIHIRITGDTTTGRLLGAQLVGHRDTAVAKRVDTCAGALHHRMTVAEVDDLDLSYTPALGSPYDAVQVATHRWTLATTAAPTSHDPFPSVGPRVATALAGLTRD